jgi:hypothetical protein
MIVYDLVCGSEHRFEGWFASADDFVRQQERELVRCPICDDSDVERRPSANIHTGRAIAPPGASAEPAAAARTEVVTGEPEALRQLKKLIADTENVGRAFPEEARKMHYEEAPPRSIRGQATHEEADQLRDEGIDFLSLPPFLARDKH